MLKLALMYSLPYGLLMWGYVSSLAENLDPPLTKIRSAVSFLVAIIYLASLQFRLDPKSILLSVVFCLVLGACVWTILQISSWRAFAHDIGMTVRSWTKPSNTHGREEPSSNVAKRIQSARGTVKRKATLLVRPALDKAASLPLPPLPKAIRKATGHLRRNRSWELNIC